MSMPERIWAARYNQSQMWFSPALFGTTDTAYVRADIVAEKDAECIRLYKQIDEKDAEIERLRKAMYPNWRKQAPYHRSDVPGHDASGVLALKCLSCMKFEPFYAMFRCFDCGSWLCRNCCMAHFGTAHLPHPAHLHEYQNHIAELDVEIERLKATIAASDERLQKAAERVGIMFGCDSADWMADRIDELWQTFETTANQLQDLKRDTDARIEFLEKALEQAAEIVVRLGRDMYPDVTNQRYTCYDEWDDDNQCWGCGYTESPELAAYLRERGAVSSTDTRPPDSGVQSGVQDPEEGGQNA